MSTASSISLPSVILLRGSTRAMSRAASVLRARRRCAERGIGVARRVRDEDRRGHREVHEHLGSERLGEVARRAKAPVGRRVRLERRVLHVLGADPEQDRAADVVLEDRPRADDDVVDGEAVPAEAHDSPPFERASSASTRLIDGEPMNPATNSLTGRS